MAGGFSNKSKLESTEFLVLNSRPVWVQMAPLPDPWAEGTAGIVSVTLGNVVLCLGGEVGETGVVDRVVRYEDQSWVGVGQNLNMSRARSNHAVSAVDINLLTLLCYQ